MTAWMPLALAGSAAAAIALFLLLPFVAGGLHHLPLAEVASGAHDPKDLWPVAGGSALGGLFHLGGFLTLIGAPFLAVAAGISAAYAAWRDRADPSRLAIQGLAVVVVVGVIAWLASPMGGAVTTWFMD